MRDWFFKNYYNLLNLDPGATKDEIESAYRSYMKFVEEENEFGAVMDKEERERIFKVLKEAYEVLTDERARFFYDSYLLWKKEAFVKIEEKKGKDQEIEKEVTGEFLRRRREKRGMSIKECSLKSCITVKIIKAIEEENIGILPPIPYLKGILKEYARTLSLPENAVIDGYLKRINEKKKP